MESTPGGGAASQYSGHLDAFFEHSPVGLLVARAGRIVRINQHACLLLGTERERLLGSTVEGVFAPGDPGAARIAESLASGRDADASCTLLSAAGEQIRVAVLVHLVGDEAGYILRDLDAQARAEAALREREANLQLLLEHAPAGIAMFDRQMRYLAVSRRWRTDYGLGDADVTGRCHYDVLPEIPERWRQIHQRCMEGASASSEEDALPRADGHTEWLRWAIHPWRKADGSVGGIIIFSEIITAQKQAQEALGRSEASLRAATAAAGLGVWAWDTRARSAWVSANWRAMFGFAPDAVVSIEDCRALVHPDDREAVQEEARAALRDHRSFSREYRSVRLDGSVLWVSTEANGTYDELGQYTGMAGVSQDISKRRDTESQLRASEARYRAIAENSGDVVWTLDLASDRFTYVSPSILRLTGHSPEELMAAPAGDAFTPESARRLHDSLPARLAAFDPVHPASNAVLSELEQPCKDGGTVHTEVVTTLIANDDGQPSQLVGVSRNITERRQSEQALRESEGRYRSLFERISEGFVLYDVLPGEPPSFRIAEINPAFEHLVKTPRSSMLGELVGAVPRYRATPILEALCRVARTGEHVRFEVHLADQKLWLDALAFPAADGRCAALFTDATTRRHTEERLRQTQKLEGLGVLAGGIAHDFNNLLTGILGHASLIQSDVPDLCKPAVAAIIQSAERAAHLTRQLLAYSGRGRFFVRDQDLARVAADIAGLVRISIPANVTIETSLAADLPPVQADPAQLQQVVTNLLLNAGEAFTEGATGRIHVSVQLARFEEPFVDAAGVDVQAGPYVCLEVTDNGVGMDPAALSHLFEPFFSTKFTGRGLGLAAVSGIMRSHRGAITVDTVPGRGTTFRVYFPPAPSKVADAQQTPGLRHERILVVDDEPSVRDFLVTALSRAGYQVQAAASAEAALEILVQREVYFDALVLDLVLPGMTGGELLPLIRARQPGVKILLTSGYSESAARSLVQSEPGAVFLQKPFSLQQVREVLADLLRPAPQANVLD
jgi:two-component system, cell cycle sensor histidine kinase and response regulator CckA